MPRLNTASPPPRYEDLPDLCTPEEGRAFLQIGRNTMYDLLKSGAIRSHKYGHLIRIPKAALLEPLDQASALRLSPRRRA
jgi:excisionase family DNA binding protein